MVRAPSEGRLAAPERYDIPPERLERWLDRWVELHGEIAGRSQGPERLTLTAADGAVLECDPPFPPLTGKGVEGLLAHVRRDRVVAVLLVRLGGHAVGVFDGDRLDVSKVGSRQVHGRSAAGGWSQQRFARRREGQVRVALAAAADLAATLLVPVAATLDAVVLGGDRRSVDTVLADVRLAPLRPLVVPPLLDVPDPRKAVLDSALARFRAVRIVLVDPPAAAGRTTLDSPNG